MGGAVADNKRYRAMGYVLAVLALAATVAAAVSMWRAQRSQPPHFTYAQLHAGFLRRDSQAPRDAVLLLGDSHVQALCEGCIGRPALNFGIGGDTVDGLRRRVDEYSAARDATNIAVVEVGANDVLWGEGAAAPEAFPALLDALRSLKRVYVYAIFPVARSAEVAVFNARIADTNRAIEQACRQRPNCVFVGLTPLYTEQGFLHEDMHAGDGIHLGNKGYTVWLRDLRERMSSAHN